MAFGIRRHELLAWKNAIEEGRIAILTHYWLDPRFPESSTVTKVGCKDLDRLASWGKQYALRREWIDRRSSFPHFDLFGDKQLEVLDREGYVDQITRFKLKKSTS